MCSFCFAAERKLGQTLGDHKDTVPCLPWLTARHAVNMLKWIIVMVSRQDGAHFSFAQGALSRCSGGWCVEKLETAGGKAFSPSPSGTWAARTHLVTHIAQAQVSLHNGSAYAKGVASVVGELGRESPLDRDPAKHPRGQAISHPPPATPPRTTPSSLHHPECLPHTQLWVAVVGSRSGRQAKQLTKQSKGVAHSQQNLFLQHPPGSLTW